MFKFPDPLELPESMKDYNIEPSPVLPIIGTVELVNPSFYRAVIAEFVASFLFLYITISAVIGWKTEVASTGNPSAGAGVLGVSWVFGGTVSVLMFCIAGISGGHINPVVTFALFLSRKVSLVRAVFYVVVQFLGALCGVWLVSYSQPIFFTRYGGGTNEVAAGYSKGAGLAAEAIGTFLLVLTVLSAIDPKRKARDSHVPILAPLPIGLAVFMVHLATMPITGTGINPTRSFATALMYDSQRVWDDHWVFWLGPSIGAAGAAAFYKYVLRDPVNRVSPSFRINSPSSF